MAKKGSKLMDDLSQVPAIIGGLGLSIAAAQKALNRDYLRNIEKILAMVQAVFGDQVGGGSNGAAADITDAQREARTQFEAVLKNMLVALAPSRYQFTETTLSVKLDLAQSFDAAISAGFGVGMGGVAVNAAMSVGYGYDYRAAAECKTILSAMPADPSVFQALLERADKLGGKDLTLPNAHAIDAKIWDQVQANFEKMTGFLPAPLKPEPPADEQTPAPTE